MKVTLLDGVNEGTLELCRGDAGRAVASADDGEAAGEAGVAAGATNVVLEREAADECEADTFGDHLLDALDRAEFHDDAEGDTGGLCGPVDHGADGIKCFALHPGGVATELGLSMPEAMHAYLVDDPALAAAFCVWLCSGQADWAKGRYLSAAWDVGELTALKEAILTDDLLVNRMRTKA